MTVDKTAQAKVTDGAAIDFELNAPDRLTLTPQKAEIVHAARDLFAQYGYDGFSIRELAMRSGVGPATIYHHFRDKEDILLHVLEQDAMAVQTRGMVIVQSDEPITIKLRQLIQLHVTLLDENRLTAVANLRRLKAMDKTMPWFIERIMPRLLSPLVAVLEQGVQQEIFRPLDSKLTAVTMMGLMHSACSFNMVVGRREPPDALVDQICNLVVYGILQQDSQRTPKSA